MMVFPVFELAKLVTLAQDGVGKEDSVPHLVQHAWKEVGEASLLALYFSNNCLLARYRLTGQHAAISQLPWFKGVSIQAMCFDPTATWLLCVGSNGLLYIVPLLSLMDPGTRVNRQWRTDDVTRIRVTRRKGTTTCVAWWHTLMGEDVAVLGAQHGLLILLDLQKGQQVACVSIQQAEDIASVQLVHNDTQSITYALVTTKCNSQWKVLLERKTGPASMPPPISPDPEVRQMGFEFLQGQFMDLSSIIHGSDKDVDEFAPLKFYQFSGAVVLSPQYAKGRHFIAAYDLTSHLYQIFDSDVEHCPLYVYKVPEGTEHIIMTDRIVFATVKQDGHHSLTLIANQMAETSLDGTLDFNDTAVIQQFEFQPEETIEAVFKRSFPFYLHEKREENLKQRGVFFSQSEGRPNNHLTTAVQNIHIASHTVLDGCIIITSHAVYECRPRVSPERLFLEMALQQCDTSQAERLAIMLGLDINTMYELAAQYCLSCSDYPQAMRLFQLSKCPHIKRVASFAEHGCIAEVVTYLQQILNNSSLDLSGAEKKQMSDMALYCYVQQMLEAKTNNHAVIENARQFLLRGLSYDETTAVTLLAQYGFMDLLLEMAKARGMLPEVLEYLVQQGHLGSGAPYLPQLLEKGLTLQVVRSANGAFLRCLGAAELVHLLSSRPQQALQHIGLVRDCLHSQLDADTLMRVVELFDLSRPAMHNYMYKATRLHRKRTSSTSSVSSMASEASDSAHEDSELVTQMVDVFLQALLLLNVRRGVPHTAPQPLAVQTQTKEEAAPKGPQLRSRCVPLDCGAEHTAVLWGSHLYTWGNNQHGRLGHTHSMMEQPKLPPLRVDALDGLKTQVMVVGCGARHTLALTQKGLYGWGDSSYGQVGVGTRGVCLQPRPVDGLCRETCVMVACGQYHSLALTAGCSWGWGVHGQLGHGDPYDRLAAARVCALDDAATSQISGGYAHSVVSTIRGEVYTFGCGMFGQLGQGCTQKSTLPQRLEELPEPIVHVATKYFHNVALGSSGQLYKWGTSPGSLKNVVQSCKKSRQSVPPGGQPSVPKCTMDLHLVPTLVDTGLVASKIVKVSCGTNFSALLTSDGEVFTWGKNFDGQLGIGHRQEQKSPVMVVKINDRKIVHLACGAEFVLVMDSDGQLWTWGSNEHGQLGQSTKLGLSRQPAFIGGRGSVGWMDRVLPVKVEGLPLLDRFEAQPAVQSARSDITVLDGEGWTEESAVGEAMLPSLAGDGPPYSYASVVLVLQSLPKYVRWQPLLRLCVDLGAWWAAAIVCMDRHLYAQAHHYYLRYLSAYGNIVGDLTPMAMEATNFIIGAITEECESVAERTGNLRRVLIQVLWFWHEQGEREDVLEELLLQHIQVAAPILCSMLLGSSELSSIPTTELKEVDLKPGMYCVPSAVRTKLSSNFYIRLVSVAGHQMLGKNASVNYSEILDRNFVSRLQGQDLNLQPPEKLISPDKLWQEILNNLLKDLDSRNSIFLSKSETENLYQACEKNSDDGSGEDAVVFTCGHQYTRAMFIKDILSDVEEQIMYQLNPPLPQTASLLGLYYKNIGLQPLACPKCVLHVLKAH